VAISKKQLSTAESEQQKIKDEIADAAAAPAPEPVAHTVSPAASQSSVSTNPFHRFSPTTTFSPQPKSSFDDVFPEVNQQHQPNHPAQDMKLAVTPPLSEAQSISSSVQVNPPASLADDHSPVRTVSPQHDDIPISTTELSEPTPLNDAEEVPTAVQKLEVSAERHLTNEEIASADENSAGPAPPVSFGLHSPPALPSSLEPVASKAALPGAFPGSEDVAPFKSPVEGDQGPDPFALAGSTKQVKPASKEQFDAAFASFGIHPPPQTKAFDVEFPPIEEIQAPDDSSEEEEEPPKETEEEPRVASDSVGSDTMWQDAIEHTPSGTLPVPVTDHPVPQTVEPPPAESITPVPDPLPVILGPARDSQAPPPFAPPIPSKDDFDDFEGLTEAQDADSAPTGNGVDHFEHNESQHFDDFDSSFDFPPSQPLTNAAAAAELPHPRTPVADWDSIFAGFETPQGAPKTAELSRLPFDHQYQPPPGPPPPPVKEESVDEPNVQQLLGMGFTRDQAVQALEKNDYDLSKATNFLLDQS